MSKKRPTESSWDSDEELLNDTSGNAITAFPKTSELDLLGDDGELDEDALLGVDETGAKTTTISFTNDSLWSLTSRQRSKNASGHQEHTSHSEEEIHRNEQAFVFEETDTADLEDELNVGGQEEDGSGYHVGGRGDYARNLYHHGVSGSASNKMQARDDLHVDYSDSGMNASDGGEMGYLSHAEQAAYGDESGAEFGAAAASGDYIGDAVHETHEDVSGVELEYEQPVEQEEQVHLEYEDSRTVDHEGNLQSQEPKNSGYESESDSDNEDSRHSRGKFTSERTGVISLTPSSTREAIPDTLEINDEQAAQIEQFMSDKSQRVKGRGRSQGRPSAHSRLGIRSGAGSQQNPKGQQGSRMAPFPQGVHNQNLQMGFPFPSGPPNRAPFPVGLLNPRGPFPLRLLNQRGIFSGPQNQRQPFPLGPAAQRGQFPVGPLNMLLGGGLQRGPFPQERFTGPPNQRVPFTGGPQSLRPQRLLRQNLGNSQQGLQHSRGPPPNQLRPQGSFIQRGVHSQQFGQRPPHMGQLGNRLPGPRNAGPRPLMGQAESGVRFIRAHRPPVNQQGQPIPSLVKTASKSLQGSQQIRPDQMNPLMPQDSHRASLHQRLGPAHGQNWLQNPTGQPQRPKFMPRGPVSGGPIMNSPVFQGNQQPLMGGQGDMNAFRKHKIYINPRFQGPKETAGTPGLGRTVKMGVPIHQKKAKILLEKAIQNQNKQASAVPAAPAGVKRKSTGGESVPAKVMKSEEATPEASSARIVQASSEPSAEESKKINALLEEQKKQRELIQKRKEIARQKQAAIKRKELEIRLKEEGKTINDILGTAKTEGIVEQKQSIPPVKQISGSVAARLGPPIQQQIKGPQQTQHSSPAPAKIRPPQSHGASGPVNSQEFSGAPPQSQNLQTRATVQTPAFSNQPKGAGPSAADKMRGTAQNSDTIIRRAAPNNNLRARGPPQRFQAPPPVNQFRASQPGFDKRYRATQPSQDTLFRSVPPNTDHRLTAPPSIPDNRLRAPLPTTDPRMKTPSHTSIQPNPVPGQSIRYTEPPPSVSQTVRFQPPHSAPPQIAAPVPATQQFQPQYTPASAPPSHPPSHYPQPSQTDTSVYASASQYTPQVASYQQAAYVLPTEHQYQPQTHHPPPSQSYAQSTTSQYHLHPQQQYQASETSQYQTQAVQPQYQPPPAQPQYHTPHVQPQYHVPPVHTQYQAPPLQSQYQALSTQQYQSSVQSYSAPSDQHYQQINVSYYSEPQPIQTVTSQVASTSTPIEDQRTVQHHVPVGQRIQTIGQRVQPASVAHMRSIIHNVVSQPSHATEASPARLVQSQPAVSRMVTDGQVKVLDGPQKILIQNVPAMATKETLIKICRHFGQVLGVNLMSEQNKAVVQFQKGEQAAKCVAKCNQKCLHKTRLTVKLLPS